MATTLAGPDAAPIDGRASRSQMKDQIIAFFTGALLIGVGLIVVFFMFVAPNVGGVDPAAAWCRGWVDGLSYTDSRSGNGYQPQTLDKAEAQCYERLEAGFRAPASRGPLTAEDQ